MTGTWPSASSRESLCGHLRSLSVLDADDAKHEAARAAWKQLLAASDPVYTSNYIIVETTALVQNRLGVAAVRTLVDDLLPAVDVEWVTPADHQAAVYALCTAGRRRLSLVDCTSFQMMRRLAIYAAFTFDGHFEEQGFSLVG